MLSFSLRLCGDVFPLFLSSGSSILHEIASFLPASLPAPALPSPSPPPFAFCGIVFLALRVPSPLHRRRAAASPPIAQPSHDDKGETMQPRSLKGNAEPDQRGGRRDDEFGEEEEVKASLLRRDGRTGMTCSRVPRASLHGESKPKTRSSSKNK